MMRSSHLREGARIRGGSQPRGLLTRRHGNQSNQSSSPGTKQASASNPSSSSSSTTNIGNKNLLDSSAKAFGIGTLAGALGSMAGMGGGFVMIPLMTSRHLLQLSQHQAHGTSLFAVTATGLSGAYAYQEHVHWPAAMAIATTAMVTARWGALVTRYMSEKALKRALGVLLLIMGPAVPAKAHFMQRQEQKRKQQQLKEGQSSDDAPSSSSLPTRRLSTILTQSSSTTEMIVELWKSLQAPAAIGIGSGFLAGVFGVGGGTIVVPALSYAMDQEITTHHQALATSLAAMTLPAAVGTVTHIRVGNVALRAAPPLAVGALCGAYVGGKWAVQTNESVLRWGFSALLTVLGVRTLWKAR